jgi:uncharacterized protein YkwD
MANNNYFDHKDRDGRTPGDRAELAGYDFQQVGENIAAGQDTVRKVVDGWMASPGHCANLMNPQYRISAPPTRPTRKAAPAFTGRRCLARHNPD